MLVKIKKRIRGESKKTYDSLINEIESHEKVVRTRVAQSIINNKKNDPNYTAIDYYKEYGSLRCPIYALRDVILHPINDNIKFNRDDVLAFDKVFPKLNNTFAYKLCIFSREYYLKYLERYDSKGKPYPRNEYVEALDIMDKYYMPYSQLYFDKVLTEVHNKNLEKSR